MAKLLVTGASGFVGRPICLFLASSGHLVNAFSRSSCIFPENINFIRSPSLSFSCSQPSFFEGVECVLHLAGRAHVMREIELDPLAAFRKSNVVDTLFLANQAANAGVKRFVFVSSVKVNGESSTLLSPFVESSNPCPLDPYGLSKYEAECGLRQISAETGMEVVIVRPPLIYGPGVKGNLRTLMTVLAKKVPLPLLGMKNNLRSFVSLGNLQDFLRLCIVHPAAAGHTFFVSDQHDLSTFDLITRLANALGVSANLFSVPSSFLRISASLVGKELMFNRLCSSLVVDSSKACRVLGWSPVIGVDEGLKATADAFLK